MTCYISIDKWNKGQYLTNKNFRKRDEEMKKKKGNNRRKKTCKIIIEGKFL